MSNVEHPNLETLLLRQASLSVILHGLITRMVDKGLLAEADIVAIRRFALDMAYDLQDAAGPQTRAAGIRIAEEVEAFLTVLVPDDRRR